LRVGTTRSSSIGWRPDSRDQCDSRHVAMIFASVGCIGTARPSSVFVVLICPVAELHARTTLLRASGSAV
jgi:hypothetical protein